MSNNHRVDVETLPCDAGSTHKLRATQALAEGTDVAYYNVCWKCGLTEDAIRQTYIEEQTSGNPS